ncbi:MAG TPA: 16S rRNA (guanine(527)-N(7))-methyltransferase RsmG [Pseudomonadales bacterium]|jgi:16S rRNA (guanine527-N7)-methyltransferase|nr:16S rRNA (guanine(527)-N(7))-methyltransferase RsmG [Gammaproteobacteria bacterium]HIL82279.1 16S rRNA (guanine(527)-N(7))-methyltransferase RsmG [Pseudomonadales bacterium]
MNLKEKIERGLVALSLESHIEVADKLEQYLALITKWNKVTNLTSIDDPEQMVLVHLLDSLSIQPYLSGPRILDVGSGAGLPGIPLALINEDKDFILLDSNGKKTRFMLQATIELGIKNIEVVQSRAQDFQGEFDQVVCRAFARTDDFVKACSHLLAPGGSLLAMKGPAESEVTLLPGFKQSIHQLNVPDLPSERYLIEIGQ